MTGKMYQGSNFLDNWNVFLYVFLFSIHSLDKQFFILIKF